MNKKCTSIPVLYACILGPACLGLRSVSMENDDPDRIKQPKKEIVPEASIAPQEASIKKEDRLVDPVTEFQAKDRIKLINKYGIGSVADLRKVFLYNTDMSVDDFNTIMGNRYANGLETFLSEQRFTGAVPATTVPVFKPAKPGPTRTMADVAATRDNVLEFMYDRKRSEEDQGSSSVRIFSSEEAEIKAEKEKPQEAAIRAETKAAREEEREKETTLRQEENSKEIKRTPAQAAARQDKIYLIKKYGIDSLEELQKNFRESAKTGMTALEYATIFSPNLDDDIKKLREQRVLQSDLDDKFGMMYVHLQAPQELQKQYESVIHEKYGVYKESKKQSPKGPEEMINAGLPGGKLEADAGKNEINKDLHQSIEAQAIAGVERAENEIDPNFLKLKEVTTENNRDIVNLDNLKLAHNQAQADLYFLFERQMALEDLADQSFKVMKILPTVKEDGMTPITLNEAEKQYPERYREFTEKQNELGKAISDFKSKFGQTARLFRSGEDNGPELFSKAKFVQNIEYLHKGSSSEMEFLGFVFDMVGGGVFGKAVGAAVKGVTRGVEKALKPAVGFIQKTVRTVVKKGFKEAVEQGKEQLQAMMKEKVMGSQQSAYGDPLAEGGLEGITEGEGGIVTYNEVPVFNFNIDLSSVHLPEMALAQERLEKIDHEIKVVQKKIKVDVDSIVATIRQDREKTSNQKKNW